VSLFGGLIAPAAEQRGWQEPGHHVSESGVWSWAGQESATGVDVTELSSLGHSAVSAAVQVIACSIAVLPLILYRRVGSGRERALEHRLYTTLHDEPNPESTWVTFCISQMVNKLLWGNRFAEIEFTQGGDPLRLWHLPSDRVTVRRVYKRPGGGVTLQAVMATPEDRRSGGVLIYEVHDGSAVPPQLEPQRMFHVPDISIRGVAGYSRIRAALETIGTGLALQTATAAVIGNDATPGGVLERPPEAPPLSPAGERKLITAFEAAHGGVKRRGRLTILQEGATFKPITVDAGLMKLVEMRQLSTMDVAQIFNISPHWLAGNTPGGGSLTYTNSETEWTNLVRRTLLHHLVADKQEIRRKLLLGDDRYFAEYETNGFMAGSAEQRAAFYRALLELGVITPNGIAAIENLPPIPAAEGGDTYRAPISSIAAGSLVSGSGNANGNGARAIIIPGRSVEARSYRGRMRLRDAHVGLLADAGARVVGREVARIRERLGQGVDAGELGEWLRAFYAEQLLPFVGTVWLAPLDAYMRAVAGEAASEVGAELADVAEELAVARQQYASRYASAYAGRHAGIVAARLRDSGVDSIDGLLEQWAESAPRREAAWQRVAAESAASITALQALGYSRKRWVARGACPLCAKLDGAVVEITGAFLRPGDRVEGGEDQEPLVVKRIIDGPPAHEGCDCTVAAE